jgi:DNA mismatch endonuclease (patch repair protein)
MADVFSKEKRSWIMSRVKSKDSLPEMIVRRSLHAKGFRYRIHVKSLPGKPDIVLPRYRTIILVHGCFWHAHEHCKKFSLPKTRTDWWRRKLDINIQNDIKNEIALQKLGWEVITVWQCQLKSDKFEATINKLIKQLNKQS